MKSPRMEYVDADRVVSKGPTWVHGIILTGDGATAELDVYNGENTAGELKFHPSAVDGSTTPLIFPFPLLFTDGIYADITGSGATSTFIISPANPSNPNEWPIPTQSSEK